MNFHRARVAPRQSPRRVRYVRTVNNAPSPPPHRAPPPVRVRPAELINFRAPPAPRIIPCARPNTKARFRPLSKLNKAPSPAVLFRPGHNSYIAACARHAGVCILVAYRDARIVPPAHFHRSRRTRRRTINSDVD